MNKTDRISEADLAELKAFRIYLDKLVLLYQSSPEFLQDKQESTHRLVDFKFFLRDLEQEFERAYKLAASLPRGC